MATATVYKLTHYPLTALDPTTDPKTAKVPLFRKQVYANCRQAPWNGHNLGHIGMIMPAAEYAAHILLQPVPAARPIAVLFVMPTFPDPPSTPLQLPPKKSKNGKPSMNKTSKTVSTLSASLAKSRPKCWQPSPTCTLKASKMTTMATPM
jgi:hypothetical protein